MRKYSESILERLVFIVITVLVFAVFSALASGEGVRTGYATAAQAKNVGTALIVIDLSGSMRGFFSVWPRPYTAIQSFVAKDLVPVLLDSNIRRFSAIPINRLGIDRPKAVSNLTEFTDFRTEAKRKSFYSADDSYLKEAFERIPVDHPFDVTIIVTDNVQDVRLGNGVKGDVVEGFDPGLFQSISKIVKSHNVWLVAVRSQFAGWYSPVKRNNNGFQVSFLINGEKATRPVFVYVIGREANKTIEVTTRLVSALDRFVGEDAVKAVPLSVIRTQSRKILFSEGELRNRLLATRFTPTGERWHIGGGREVVCARFSLEGFSSAKNLKVFSPQLKPSRKWASVREDEKGEWNVCLDVASIPGLGFFSSSSKRNEVTLDVAIRPAEELASEIAWLQKWSTDDDSLPENKDQTLYLSRLQPIVMEALQQSRREAPLGRVSLEITRAQ